MSEPQKSKRLATYDDVLRAPPNKVAEILDGELHLSPRPGGEHAVTTSLIGSDLTGPFHRRGGGGGGPGGWWILDEPELHRGRDVVVPDLAGWRRERLPIAPHGPFQTLAPDWVCEVLSPSTARRDRFIKLEIYRREKVGHVWLVDPLARTVEVYRLVDGAWMLRPGHAGSAAATLEPFDAVSLDASRWWGETPDPVDDPSAQ